MNVPQEDLNLWRQFFDRLRVTCREAMRDLDTRNVQRARSLIEQTEDAARRMALRLERAGADRPDAPAMSLSLAVPLEMLDTPTNRRYAEALRTAWEAGLAVDRERWGERIGTDGPAQVIEMVLDNVEQEIHGPTGF